MHCTVVHPHYRDCDANDDEHGGGQRKRHAGTSASSSVLVPDIIPAPTGAQQLQRRLGSGLLHDQALPELRIDQRKLGANAVVATCARLRKLPNRCHS